MDRDRKDQFPYAPMFWPALAAGEAASSMAAHFLEILGGADGDRTPQPPEGVTPGEIAIELQTGRLRDFASVQCGVPTLLCTPFALHGAAIADLAAGHSLVAALRGAGIERLFLVDWRSASPEMRFLGIDDYLAALNVLVDHLGGVVDLVGLCQGGWLSLTYAARFPAKVRKLVMAGTPVDVAAGQSKLSAIADATPLSVFKNLVSLGDGRVIGRRLAKFWGNNGIVAASDIREALQTQQPAGSPEFAQLEAAFRNWNAWTIDMPGTYYLEVIEKFYKRNELAAGSFVALGQRIDLSRLRLPMYLLAGSADEVVAAEQLFAVTRLVGTPPAYLRGAVAPSSHLGLFMGKRTLEEYWPGIALWLKEPLPCSAEGSEAVAVGNSNSSPAAA
jgi:poly(3-hydroxyalkanoate) synthetase